MATLDVYNQDGKKLSQLELAKSLESPVKKTLLWEIVKMQQANRRAGNAATKTRGMVTGSTKKIYRQKGSGNARHGDIKAPIFVGGGQTFGPLPRDYSYLMPKKARANALKSALALKIKEGKLKIVDKISFSKIKTKDAAKFFSNLGIEDGLLVIEKKDLQIEKSVRNLPHHKVLRVDGINVYDILKYDQLVLTQESLQAISGRFQ